MIARKLARALSKAEISVCGLDGHRVVAIRVGPDTDNPASQAHAVLILEGLLAEIEMYREASPAGRIRAAADAVLNRLDIPAPLRAEVVEQTHELLRRLEAVEEHDDNMSDETYDPREYLK